MMSERRKAEFEQREGEDPNQWIARQLHMATPFEAGWLRLIRDGDPKQREALEIIQAAQTATWTRRAVLIALLTIPVNLTIALLGLVCG